MHIFKCERHLEIDLQACHEWLVNRLVWSWYMHRLMPMYLLTFFFLFQRALQMLISKREFRDEKAIAHTSIWLRKRESDLYYNVWCQSQRLNCQSLFKMFMASILKNLSCFDQKYVKWKQTKKLSIKCNHIGEGSYIFISTSEIGYLTLY